MGTFLRAVDLSKLSRQADRWLTVAALVPLLVSPLLLLAACSGKPAAKPASSLTQGDRATLASYEKLRAALANDDLRGTKSAATDLAATIKANDPAADSSTVYASASEIINTAALDRARDSFKPLSAAIIAKAGGVEGFYVMSCPMTPNGEWLQTNPKVDNPYMGKIMRDCGEVKK